MKLVKCIIQPERVNDVIETLVTMIPGLTVSEARGHGRQKGHSAIYRGQEYQVSLIPKTVVEIVIEDNKVEDIIKVIVSKARTGNIGDGRIFVLPVEENYHVRTGFMDRD
jgi:nitrogen regulatory protein P-II 1